MDSYFAFIEGSSQQPSFSGSSNLVGGETHCTGSEGIQTVETPPSGSSMPEGLGLGERASEQEEQVPKQQERVEGSEEDLPRTLW